MRSTLLMAMLLFLDVLSCDGRQAETRAAYIETIERVYPAAWGQALPDEERRAAEERFDCVWERAVEEGADLAADFACVNRQLTTLFACTSDLESFSRCHDEAHALCTRSAAYERAAAACTASNSFFPH
jgi:hypothetical protein